MKKFLNNMCIWLAILLIFSICADRVITLGLRKSDIRKFAVWNDIYDAKIDADVIIIGSSETWSGYNTYIIDSLLHCNSYNLGIDGHSFRYQLLRYNTYRRYCPRPKLIIINMDFPGTFDMNERAYEREQFFPYIKDDSLINQISSDKKVTIFDRYLPAYRYFGYRNLIEDGIRSFLGKQYEDGGMHKGYRGDYHKWSSGCLYMDTIFEAANHPEVVSMLNAFVQTTENEGIKVLLVEFPEYYLLRNKFKGVSDAEASLNRVAIMNGVPLFDYSNLWICFDSTLYINPSHLNKKGAELFTFELCHDLDSLGLLK